MADPVSAGLTAGSSLIKGIAGLNAGLAQRRALASQAQQEEIAGNAQAQRIGDQARAAIGQQTAALNASGFQGDSGTALDALTESQVNRTLDMMQTRRQAQAKAQALQTQGDLDAQKGGFDLASNLIGGASSIYGQQKGWGVAQAPS
jgi:hypothetical protein